MHLLSIGFTNYLFQVDSWIFIHIILFPIRGVYTIYNLVDRVIQLSHPKFHKKNFDHIIKMLIDNGYPLDLIFTSIRKRLHTHRSKVRNEVEKHPTSYFTIPYVSCIANKFIQYFKNITFCKLAFSCYNKLNRFITVHKDVLPITSLTNVVYQIDCLDCDLCGSD